MSTPEMGVGGQEQSVHSETTTKSTASIIEVGRKAADDIKAGSKLLWENWQKFSFALRHLSLTAAADKQGGGNYSTRFSKLLKDHDMRRFDEQTRAKCIKCDEHKDEIALWRSCLDEQTRASLNNPQVVFGRFAPLAAAKEKWEGTLTTDALNDLKRQSNDEPAILWQKFLEYHDKQQDAVGRQKEMVRQQAKNQAESQDAKDFLAWEEECKKAKAEGKPEPEKPKSHSYSEFIPKDPPKETAEQKAEKLLAAYGEEYAREVAEHILAKLDGDAADADDEGKPKGDTKGAKAEAKRRTERRQAIVPSSTKTGTND
jgi:hypothetical protein